MVVHMSISDDSWTGPYFAAVPALLAEYGAASIAGSRDICCLEGDADVPDRIAVLRFPSMDSIRRFMADPRYQPFRAERERGARSQIFIFDNAVINDQLV